LEKGARLKTEKQETKKHGREKKKTAVFYGKKWNCSVGYHQGSKSKRSWVGTLKWKRKGIQDE